MEIRELKPDVDRMFAEFKELTSIDALSLCEREIADVLKQKLGALGADVQEDDAAEKIGGTAGNLLAYLPSTYEEGSMECEQLPILLSAHMDTVVPGEGKQASLDTDGVIRGNGKAVLGADDVTGIVEILEGIRLLEENGIPHRAVEILFTVSEENYTKGAHAFDMSKLKARDAYIFDLSGPVGIAAVRAPSLIWFQVDVTGRAAHAGFCPEQGIHAVEVAAKAIARLREGYLDDETTFNVGSIRGGKVSNIVPDHCVVCGEARSLHHENVVAAIEEMKDVFRQEAEKIGARVEFKESAPIFCYDIPVDDPVCERFLMACEKAGIKPAEGDSRLISTFGGSDNNVFAQRGIRGIVVSSGMYDPHSPGEYTRIEDLSDGARLVAGLCTL